MEPLNNDVTNFAFLIMGFILLAVRLPESLFWLGHCSGGKVNFLICGMFERLGGPVVCTLDSRLRDPIFDLQGLLCCGTRYSHFTLVYKWVLAK